MIFWETTSKCNLSCSHCRREPGAGDSGREDLDWDQTRLLLDGIADKWATMLVLSGGEPLLREDIFGVAAYAVALGLQVGLATNGTLIDETMADRIACSGMRVAAVSLDSANPESHNRKRGQKGCYEQAVKGIVNLKNAGVPVQINTTVTSENLNEMEGIYNLAAHFGVTALHFFIHIPVGCGATIPKTQRLDVHGYLKTLQWVLRKSADKRIRLRVTCAPQYNRLAKKESESQRSAGKDGSGQHPRGQFNTGCLAGKAICFISSDGQVQPCGYLPLSCGNVRESSIFEIWNEAALLRQLRDQNSLKGKCGKCGKNDICGGCRARAYAVTGDVLEDDPLCLSNA